MPHTLKHTKKRINAHLLSNLSEIKEKSLGSIAYMWNIAVGAVYQWQWKMPYHWPKQHQWQWQMQNHWLKQHTTHTPKLQLNVFIVISKTIYVFNQYFSFLLFLVCVYVVKWKEGIKPVQCVRFYAYSNTWNAPNIFNV